MQKTQQFFFLFFWDPRPKSQILTPQPCPPFRKFFIRYIEQWTKTFCKKTGRQGRSEIGQPAMILKFTGRVEKILTGSISDSMETISNFYLRCLIRLIFAICDISLTLESFQKFFLCIFQSLFCKACSLHLKKLIHVCEMRYGVNLPLYTVYECTL